MERLLSPAGEDGSKPVPPSRSSSKEETGLLDANMVDSGANSLESAAVECWLINKENSHLKCFKEPLKLGSWGNLVKCVFPLTTNFPLPYCSHNVTIAAVVIFFYQVCLCLFPHRRGTSAGASDCNLTDWIRCQILTSATTGGVRGFNS